MSEFVEEACLCTYSLGKTNLLHQAIYTCETCSSGASNICCCGGCASVCHKGHDINFIAFGESYCDCGHSGCALADRSNVVAAKILSNDKAISLDKNGRVGGDVINNHCSISAFAVDSICGLTEHVATELRNDCISLVTQSKETFWLGMNSVPRCALEEMASVIFQHHIAKYDDCIGLDRDLSGAEWWTQVKYGDVNDQNSTSVSENKDNKGINGGGVDLHYDKDEEVASQFNVGIFPHISTVTYLTDGSYSANNSNISSGGSSVLASAPTIVCETTSTQSVGSGIKRCYVSIPEVGKHVSFDGRFLHGAPGQLKEFAQKNYVIDCVSDNDSGDVNTVITNDSANSVNSDNQQGQLRVTFLVNIWLNHHPAAVHPLPQEIVSHLLLARRSDSSGLSTSYPTNTSTTLSDTLSIGSVVEDTNSNKQQRRFDTITTVDITERLTGDDVDTEYGEWQRIPFVSTDTEWGKSEDEAGLALLLWMPWEVKTILALPPLQNSGNRKKKTKLTHHSNTTSSQKDSTIAQSLGPIQQSNTFQFNFRDKVSHARLEYDEDSEAEDEFAGEFSGGVDVN